MFNILSLIISIISLITSVILAIKQYKQANNSDKVAKQGNNLSSTGNNIANYSTNVQIDTINPILASVSHSAQLIQSSNESDVFSTTLKLSGDLKTTYGNISWIGAITPNHFPDYSFDTTTIRPNDISSKKDGKYFQVEFTIIRNRAIDDFIRSRIYICTLDSNFNVSINLIQIITEYISRFSVKNASITLKTDRPQGSHFKPITSYFRCFTEYELLTYESTKLNKPWINSKNTENLNLKSQKNISDIFEKNESINLIKDEIKEIRSYITDITG